MSESPSPPSTDSHVSEVSSRPEEPAVASQQLRSSSSRASSGLDLPFGRQSPGKSCRAVQDRQQPPVTTGGNVTQQDAVSDLLGLHISPTSTWPVSKCSTLQHVQGPGMLQPMGLEQHPSAMAEGCVPAYQQRQQQTSRMHVNKPAAAWEAQWPPVPSGDSLPGTQAAHDFWHTLEAGNASPPLTAGSAFDLSSQAQEQLLSSDHAVDKNIEQEVSDMEAELATLRQQVWLHANCKGRCNCSADADKVHDWLA